jgi:PAS domain S-box-containing protein
VSSNVEQLSGYTTGDFLDREIVYEDLIYREDLARVVKEVEVSAESNDGDTIFHAPYRIITKNGDIKWVSDKTSLTRDSNGNIESYQGVVFDITGEVEATERLRKRTQELKSLLETSQALNLSLEINEVLQIVTDTAADFTGVDSVAIYLAGGEDLYLGATTPPLDPDMPEIFRRAMLSDHPHIQDAVSRKQPIILEDTHSAELTEAERAISDARGLRTVVYLPISVGDNVLGILILGTIGFTRIFSAEDLNLWQTMANQTATSLENALLHEQAVKRAIDLEKQIRERERVEQTLIVNEQNFRDLVENLQDGVAIADENGLHLFVNNRLSEITGYSEAELLKMTGWDFSRPEDRGKYEARMKERLSGKSVQANYERILQKKDGTKIPVEMSTTTTIWQGERRPMAIIRDITERKLVEREKDILLIQVQEANDRLRSLSRELISSQEAERKRISQELHDEFGQALTAISLDLGILERQLDPRHSPEIQERMADLRQTVDQLDQMIGELALDLRPSLLDDLGLLPTLNWYLERFSQRTETKVEIEVSGEEERLPTEIETALYRIIQEALTNVAKHAEASVIVLKLNHQPDKMTASIEDDGKGFDLNELHNAKTPFQGLGLIGMGDRTALLGGQLDIQSIPGEGTKIEVVIPL